jgi:hypothetical protein
MMTKRTVLTLIFTLAAAALVRAGEDKPRTFTGAINTNLAIRMTLTLNGPGGATGTYQYEKFKKDIMLRGELTEYGGLRLTEFDPAGKPTAAFEGTLTAAGTYSGTWTSADGKKSYPFLVKEDMARVSPPGAWPAAGEWHRRGDSAWVNSSLDIGRVTSGDFGFALSALYGGHVGALDGLAKINGDRAEFSETEFNCRLTFIRSGQDIKLETSPECSAWGGANVTFDGVYTQGPRPPDPAAKARTALTERGVFRSAVEEKAFAQLTGQYYQTFVDSFMITSDSEDLDGRGAKVTAGGVTGLFSVVEAIVMVGPQGELWAAVIDNDVIRYFTNVPADRARLPKTINAWREPFRDKKVIYPAK